MIKFIDNIIQGNSYLNEYPDSYYIYSCIDVSDSDIKININTGLTTQTLSEIINFLKKTKYDNIILSVRSNKEPNTKEFPTNLQKETISSSLKSKNITFFNQDPWPSPVPNFNKNNIVIRFGYDEGSNLDKESLKNIKNDINIKSGKYFVLLNKKISIQLLNKKIII